MKVPMADNCKVTQTSAQTSAPGRDRKISVSQAERQAFACLAQVDRPRALRAFFVFKGLTNRQLGALLGTDETNVCRLVSGVSAPLRRLDALLACGVPSELLPEPTSNFRAHVESIPKIEITTTQKGDAA